jgi:hypothetical protein
MTLAISLGDGNPSGGRPPLTASRSPYVPGEAVSVGRFQEFGLACAFVTKPIHQLTLRPDAGRCVCVRDDSPSHPVLPSYSHPVFDAEVSCRRVVSSVKVSDSFGILVTNGPTIQPNPVGIPRVNDTDSH